MSIFDFCFVINVRVKSILKLMGKINYGNIKNEMEMIGLRFKKVILLTIFIFIITGCAKKSDSASNTSTSVKGADYSQATEVSVSTNMEQEQTTTEASAKKESQSTVNKKYTNVEKQSITNQFTEWAGKRAAIGGMALNNRYFDHGASGRGDWYAVTEEGKYILVQRQDPNINLSEEVYSADSLGGVVFYSSKEGAIGFSNEINESKNTPSLATGFNEIANMQKPIVKYMLGSDGIVYEFQSNGSFSDGFYVTDDQGNFDYWPTKQLPFKISEDTDAQSELKAILSQYN